jgi:hypothetical protein
MRAMLKLGMRQVIDADFRRRRMSLPAYIAKLRTQARRDRQEIEGLWIIWSHAADEIMASSYLRNIRELQYVAADKEERADVWERELIRRVEAAHHTRSLKKLNDINNLGPTVSE